MLVQNFTRNILSTLENRRGIDNISSNVGIFWNTFPSFLYFLIVIGSAWIFWWEDFFFSGDYHWSRKSSTKPQKIGLPRGNRLRVCDVSRRKPRMWDMVDGRGRGTGHPYESLSFLRWPWSWMQLFVFIGGRDLRLIWWSCPSCEFFIGSEMGLWENAPSSTQAVQSESRKRSWAQIDVPNEGHSTLFLGVSVRVSSSYPEQLLLDPYAYIFTGKFCDMIILCLIIFLLL